jgi:cytidylate kinase
VGQGAKPLIVAIDGPAGAGKSTVARALAGRLGFTLVDTGAIYRAVALQAIRSGLALDDDAGLARVVAGLELALEFAAQGRVLLGGADVTDDLRTPALSTAASQVSRRPVVREGLLGLQRRLGLAAGPGAVLEGRDIGTVVFPDADLKVFLFAAPEVRARRRHEELVQKGAHADLAEVLAQQNQRDRSDSEREVAPLRAADDAVQLDTSALGLPEVLDRLEALVRARRGA